MSVCHAQRDHRRSSRAKRYVGDRTRCIAGSTPIAGAVGAFAPLPPDKIAFLTLSVEVLVGCPMYPLPTNRGDKLRWAALLTELSSLVPLRAVFGLFAGRDERSHDFESRFASVEVVAPGGFWRVGARAALMELRGEDSAFGRLATSRWRTRLLAAASTHSPVLLLGGVTGLEGLDGRAAVDLIDVRSRVRTTAGDRPTGRRSLLAELEFAKRFLVILTSDEERSWLLKNGASPQNVLVIPNGVDRRFLAGRPDPASKTILFVGNFAYAPNREGVGWFLRECWPTIRSREPTTTLRLVGYEAARLAIGANPGVEVVPDAPDILPHYASAALAIAPLQSAAGTQNKVLEPMAVGLPVVSTSAVARGLFSDHPVLVRDVAPTFAEACLRLLDDREEREELGVRGREYVSRRHDWSASAVLLLNALSAIA